VAVCGEGRRYSRREGRPVCAKAFAWGGMGIQGGRRGPPETVVLLLTDLIFLVRETLPPPLSPLVNRENALDRGSLRSIT
jgi:hypothetical protein